jgi:uncharacterized protein (DUF58 family)
VLTPRGWAVLVGAVLVFVAGRALGAVELSVLAAAAGLGVAAAWFLAGRRRPRVAVRRRVEPLRIHLGQPARVDLEVINRHHRRSAPLAIADAFEGGARSARFVVPPLAPKETARAAYRLPSNQRGVFDLGPVTLESSDPLGLVRHVTEAPVRSTFTVFPRVLDVLPMPLAAGRERTGSITVRSRASVGEDFRTLREYVVGDDLRRVHWRSSARTEDLMVREEEAPWDSRDAVLVDTRAGVYADPATFEVVVEMAASLLVAGRRAHRTPRLVLSSQPFEVGNDQVETALERLAAVRTGPDDPFALAVDELGRHFGGGAVAVLTGALADSELARVVRLGGQFGFVAIARFGSTSGGDGGAVGFARPRHGVLLADIPAGADAPSLWTEIVHRARTRPEPLPITR